MSLRGEEVKKERERERERERETRDEICDSPVVPRQSGGRDTNRQRTRDTSKKKSSRIHTHTLTDTHTVTHTHTHIYKQGGSLRGKTEMASSPDKHLHR